MRGWTPAFAAALCIGGAAGAEPVVPADDVTAETPAGAPGESDPMVRAETDAESRRAPAPNHVLVGEAREYDPLLQVRPLSFIVAAPLSAALTYESVSSTPVARDLEFSDEPGAGAFVYDPEPALDTQLRVGFLFDTAKAWSPLFITAEYEHDLLTGVFDGGTEADGLVDPPFEEETETQLRKAYGRVTFGPIVTLAGGFMTSHWGLGLLANDGAHDWAPGSAYFGDPRRGDRVLRGLLATGPWTGADLFLAAGYDVVQGDDVTLGGDEARQVIAAATLGYERPRTIGVYGVYRTQEAEDGKETEVGVVDLYGKWSGSMSARVDYTTEVEAAVVFGETELSPTPEHARHDVLQLGVATRIGIDAGGFGGVLDFLYASGDQNFEDGEQNAFKPDPNYEVGLFLFRHLLAATTARAPVTAANAKLSGVPAEDLERFPTRGSASNTYTFFPRLWYRPVAGFELYGGPLFAFTNVPLADPVRTKQHGGVAHNAFDAAPGDYLGTELDLGVRYRTIIAGTELTVGVEGGVFQPGSAFDDAEGDGLDAIGGARALLSYRL